MTGPLTSSPPSRRRIRARAALLAAPLLCLGFVDLPQDKTAPLPRHGTYIGRAQCIECHEDEDELILSGTHKQAVHDQLLQSCETCHGPGEKHADDEDNATELITYPPKLGKEHQEQLCGRCHAAQIAAHGGDLQGFYAAGKKCTDCHKVHAKAKPAPHTGVHFRTRADASTKAEPVGGQKCVTCHPLRDAKLHGTGHARFSAKADPKGCETCHGNGSLHVETGGVARLITKPSAAADGAATCRSCHSQVDPVEFHWKGKHRPLLSRGMTCTTCHTIHAPLQEVPTARAKTKADPQMRGDLPQLDNGSCAKCHAPAYPILHGTIHEKLADKSLPLDQGCGACHEGAAAHARGPGKKALVESMHGTDAAFQTKTCAQCHDKDQALRHSLRGAHARNEVTCLTCHSPAAKKGRVREDASKRCATCHTKAAAEFKMPNRHPVKIGKHDTGTMLCVDCHDPHSARPRIRNRQLREAKCVSCHKQYRGPFVYAHQASRTDGCVVCHSPHGSTNKRMLKQHSTQQNCIACHADYPSFHDQTQGAVFTNCLNCHTEVHGSNHSRYYFR